jgi:transposase InsO family protein
VNKDPATFVAYLSPNLQTPEVEPIFDLQLWKEKMAEIPSDQHPTGSNWTSKDGLVYFHKDGQRLLWVPPSLRQLVLRLHHDPPSVGHAGIHRMQYSMRKQVFWGKMKEDIADFCRACKICQQYKSFRHFTPMMSTPVPFNCFEDISMDVVGPVPPSRNGNCYVLAIQDRLSRWIKFAAMPDASAITTVRTFISEWVCTFGTPKRVLTDRGTNFTAKLTQEITRFLGAKSSFTTAYRPQGNGQNERSHRELHGYIGMYLNEAHSDSWDLLLNHAAWVHNTAKHEALNASPYEIVTGMVPRSLKTWDPNYTENFESEIQTMQKVYGVNREKLEQLRLNAREAITQGQARYLTRLNKYAKARTYNIGDLVWVRSHKAATYEEKKWLAKYLGPYSVTKVISPVVIEVAPPDNLEKTNLVHASYLKPYTRARSPEPPPRDTHQPEVESELFSAGNDVNDASTEQVLPVSDPDSTRTPHSTSRQFPFFTFRDDDRPDDSSLVEPDAYNETWDFDMPTDSVPADNTIDETGDQRNDSEIEDEDVEIFSPPRVGTGRAWFQPFTVSTPRPRGAAASEYPPLAAASSPKIMKTFFDKVMRRTSKSDTSTISTDETQGQASPPSTSSTSSVADAVPAHSEPEVRTRAGRVVKPPVRYTDIKTVKKKKK